MRKRDMGVGEEGREGRGYREGGGGWEGREGGGSKRGLLPLSYE